MAQKCAGMARQRDWQLYMRRCWLMSWYSKIQVSWYKALSGDKLLLRLIIYEKPIRTCTVEERWKSLWKEGQPETDGEETVNMYSTGRAKGLTRYVWQEYFKDSCFFSGEFRCMLLFVSPDEDALPKILFTVKALRYSLWICQWWWGLRALCEIRPKWS